MLFNILQLILNCKKVYSDLSIKDIQKTVNEVFINDLESLKETIANPLFGFVADKAGLNYNIRFFSPYIQPDHKNGERDFKKDTSKDPITSLLIRLYPSPGGQLVSYTRGDSNPVTLFKSDMNGSVRFLAKLFVSILEDKNDFSLDDFINKNLKISSSRTKLLKDLKKSFLEKKTGSIFDEKAIKLVLVHSYIINIFDPCINGVTEDNLKLYLSEIGEHYKKHLKDISNKSSKDMFLDIKVEKEVLEAAVEYYKSIDSDSFPYSRLNRPQDNQVIPSYIRKYADGSKADIFNKNVPFSDCADIVLLHICNCLFFRDGRYDLSHLPKISDDLKNFYIKHPKPYTLTEEIRNEWSKVIQDLNEGVDDNSKYPTDHISYKLKKTNNEVKSGIINMMNVLIKITGLEAKDFFDKKDEAKLEEKLEEKLKLLIERLSIKEKNDRKNEESVAKVIFERKFQKVYTNINNKSDFIGKFQIEFNYKTLPQKTININYEAGHGYVSLDLENYNSYFSDDKKRELKIKLANDCYQNLLFKSLLFPEDLKSGNETDLNLIYLIGRIDNDDLRMAILEKICKLIDTLNKPETTKNLEYIMTQILNKTELSDERTRRFFGRFLCLKKTALKYNAELAIYAYEKTKTSTYYRSAYLKSRWEQLFLNEIPECEKLSLRFNSSYFSFDLVVGHLGKFVNLKELEFTNLEKNQLKIFIKKLKNPKLIEKLNLSYNSELIFPKEIEILTNLKSINLSNCELESIPVEVLDLSSLEELDLSWNFRRNSFVFCKSLKNLKNLNLSANLIRELPKNFENLPKLEVLDLRKNFLQNLPIELLNIKSLTKIYVDLDNISDETKSLFGDKLYE